jgi:hypothetical protein
MTGLLTSAILLNLLRRVVLCRAAVRLKQTFVCEFRQSFSMKLPSECQLLLKSHPLLQKPSNCNVTAS